MVSGLDPHLSVKALEIQVPRIAKMRNIEETELLRLIENHIESPLLGFLGPEKVHVLELNIALDKMAGKKGVEDVK
ncbi:potassium-transporting ATPase subunit C [Sphingobacterium daejeonense]|uniref:potassium-transporting ATPase subunit C n=1 Tax=Sphingobacterium daejeonense TaxID=371142 RepID=UPI0010C290C4|nr:potassium-transporting ATPase subunit C [Sphingobacterium daejeonense]VTP97220.1 potassium-transporting ATPase subunit C [Sphingobacterium daejeonense]